MRNRGLILNREYATQIRDFSGLLFGNITPTDIDGLIDFRDRIFIIMEFKHSGAPIPFGQKLALERLTDIICETGRIGIGLIAEHNTNGDIDCANCLVTQYRYRKQWVTPLSQFNVKEIITHFLNKYRG